MAVLKAKGKKPAPGRNPSASKLAAHVKNKGGTRSSPSTNGIMRASAIIKAVADPIRLDILLTLVDGESAVAELSERSGGNIPATSHHLAAPVQSANLTAQAGAEKLLLSHAARTKGRFCPQWDHRLRAVQESASPGGRCD